MSLYDRIEADIKAALKQKEALKVSTLRMVLAAAKNLEIEKKVKRLEDPDLCQVMQKQIKQHRDSIDQFEKGERFDLAQKEKAELAILETYLPKQLSADELVKVVEEAIKEAGALTRKDAGKVMKLVLEKVKGRADGKAVNQLVTERLK